MTSLADLAREHHVYPMMCGTCGNHPGSLADGDASWTAQDAEGEWVAFTCTWCGTVKIFPGSYIEKAVRTAREMKDDHQRDE
jgi:hypothetical protein